MVHESGHAFRQTLNDVQMGEFTRWAGFDSVEQFRSLEAQFQSDAKKMSDADRKLYTDAEEKFARGFERYLIDGSAPTVGLKAIFKKFTNYLLDFYKAIKDTLSKDYSEQGEFVFNGQVLNINAEINGVRLRDIFDSMLTNEAQRTVTFDNILYQRINQIRLDKANQRLDEVGLHRKARNAVTREILEPFGSLESADFIARTMDRPIIMKDGTVVDDMALFDAIATAKANADAVSRFWRENPEYYAWLASFKDSPEEMMRYVLHTFSKNFYYSQPKAQQQAILNNYGPEFYQTIIDPSTSNWREADIDKMAFWEQGLTGNIPDVERFDKIRKQQQTLQFYAPQVVSDYDLFLAEQDRLFPDQSAKKKPYYALDKTQKSAYRKSDPLFDQYLTWEWEYKNAHPNVKIVIDDRNNYYDELMAYDSFGDMSESVVSDFDYWAVTGKPMRGTTLRMLHNLYDKYADPNYNTFEQYLELLKQYR